MNKEINGMARSAAVTFVVLTAFAGFTLSGNATAAAVTPESLLAAANDEYTLTDGEKGKAIKATADEISALKDKNIHAANAKYKDKAVLVAGTVGIIGTTGRGLPEIVLNAKTKNVPPILEVRKESLKYIEGLEVGDTIVMMCLGWNQQGAFNPHFFGCIPAEKKNN